MPRIDFYVLENSQANGTLLLACKLIEKAYKNRHRIYVHMNDEVSAHTLDELLWTYREDSFLPHNLYGEGPEPPPPIQIGFGTHAQKQKDVLLNLSSVVPEFYAQFARILEIVPIDSEGQQAARENYRYYRNQGHDINTHKIEHLD